MKPLTHFCVGLLAVMMFLAFTTEAVMAQEKAKADKGTVASAKPQDLQIALPGGVVTSNDVKHFASCKFVPRIKQGMTNSEANDAIDAAWDKFVQCWKNRGKPTKGPGAG